MEQFEGSEGINQPQGLGEQGRREEATSRQGGEPVESREGGDELGGAEVVSDRTGLEAPGGGTGQPGPDSGVEEDAEPDSSPRRLLGGRGVRGSRSRTRRRVRATDASGRRQLAASQRMLILDSWMRSKLPAADFASIAGCHLAQRAAYAGALQAPHLFYKLDNMDRVIAVGGFSSTAGIDLGSDDPTTETANRVSLSQTFYDEQGRVWKEQRHKIDVSDGSDDDNLQTLSWYDHFGRLVKRDGSQLEKMRYDRLDRQTHHFTLASDNDSVNGDADDVAGDIVLVEDQTTFEEGEVVMQARIERLYDDKGASETTGALDTDGDSDALKYTAANVKGRIQISGLWYDLLDRQVDRVEFGTYGGSDFDRDGMSVPARSDTALRVTYTYNDDGTLREVTDPKGIVQRTEYDALGRRTKVIANYTDGTPGGGTHVDEDQTVSYAYTNGLQVTITADLPSPQTDQVTTYTYGVTKGSSAGDSEIARGDLIHTATYPDSASGTDVVSFAYNAQGQQIWKKDQAGNVQETDFDTAGRETARRVTSLDGDFDGAVLRISRTYNSRGLPELVTQYDAATSGNVVDEVKYGYDSWGLLSSFAQDRNSAVGASGSVDHYLISYTWAKATSGRNALRLVSVTFPSGRTVTLSYRSTAYLHDDEASRVTQILDEGTPVATYNYNGLDTVVGTTLDEPDVMSKLFGSTSGSFPDLDRFNRVVTSRWTKDLATDRDFYRVDLGYDRNSNIVSAEDGVHAGFDVLYTNDDLNRLVRAEEGTLSGGSITSRTRDQQWTLSQVGNWDLDKVDLNGDGDFLDAEELEDARTHNAVNELSARDIDSDSSDDYSLAYDEAGNLTDDGESYTYEWDAFYRLRKIRNRSTQALVAEYKYNGLGYRISIHEDTDDDQDVDASDKWFHHAFDERWRWVATFREDDSDPKEEFLHHAAGLDGRGTGSYIDLVILRDRDINSGWTSAADGTLEERVYYCQNWRADVSALVTDAGQMLEWVKYSAYGVPFGLPGGDANSDGDCDAADLTQVTTWVEMGPYDVRGDVDLDGDVDEDDSSAIAADYSGIVMGRGVLSDDAVGNRRGYAGMRVLLQDFIYESRRRHLHALLGRWMSKDPLGCLNDQNLYQYCRSQVMPHVDPSGLLSVFATSRGNSVTQGPGLVRWMEVTSEWQRRKECCDKYDDETNGKIPDGKGGFLDPKGAGWVCCEIDGVSMAIPCNFVENHPIGSPFAAPPQSTAGEIIRYCLEDHEKKHAGDIGSCQGKGDGVDPKWGPGYKNPDGTDNKTKISEREIALLKAQQECVDQLSGKCVDPGAESNCMDVLNEQQVILAASIEWWINWAK